MQRPPNFGGMQAWSNNGHGLQAHLRAIQKTDKDPSLCQPSLDDINLREQGSKWISRNLQPRCNKSGLSDQVRSDLQICYHTSEKPQSLGPSGHTSETGRSAALLGKGHVQRPGGQEPGQGGSPVQIRGVVGSISQMNLPSLRILEDPPLFAKVAKG